MEAGDVVFGAFAVKDQTLTDHLSVVVQVEGSQAMLVYVTSIKPGEPILTRSHSREFTLDERTQASFHKRSRYDASIVSIVPLSKLKVIGKLPDETTIAITQEVQLAIQSGRLLMETYNPQSVKHVTRNVSRQKHEAEVI